MAQDPPPPSAPALGAWAVERIRLTDGRELQGFVESEEEGWVNLAEIRRPPGRPMFVVLRPVQRATIASVVRLEPKAHAELGRRVEQFVQRATIEAGRMEAVHLTTVEKEGLPHHSYRGKWFSLESTADLETTQRIVLRIEQIFTAYRQIIPPRVQPVRPLRMAVFGSLEEYSARLDQLGLKIGNRAVFLPADNLLLAGSELDRYHAEIAAIADKHRELRAELRKVEGQLPDRLGELGRQLQGQGVSRGRIHDLVNRERRNAEQEIKQKQGEIRRYEKQNDQAFERVAGRMLARLGHEGFHAYLENYVYPHDKYDVPQWLNEGLAAVFEGGQLESGTLRLDAPNRAILAALKADLSSSHPLELQSLLAADARAFLVGHDDPRGGSNRNYAHAWGLVYYLTFQRQLLGSDRLQSYVGRQSHPASAVERFEKLIGAPLGEFERAWRAYIERMSGLGLGS
jgi:hypothetical protein